MTETFSGKIAFVTSAGAGMGLATTQAFARADASVILADVNPDAANEAVRCGVAIERDVAAAIRINVVCEGVIQTPMLDGLSGGDEAAKAELIKAQPIGRLGRPEKIANAYSGFAVHVPA